MSRITLTGKKALITGASRGLGAAMARAFAQEGADVALCARNQEQLDKLADELRALGRTVVVIAADLADIEHLPTIITRAAAGLGGLDIIVNNAGISPIYKPTLATSRDEWEEILRVNLTAPFFLTNAAGQFLIDQGKGGSIIQIASVAGLLATPKMLPYAITKAGLIEMARTLGAEWARYAIRVNAIAPGYIATDLTSAMMSVPRYVDGIKAATPLGRIGTPDEIAGIAVYLASDAASFATGQVFVIDGGISIV